MTPELSRILTLDRIGTATSLLVEANAEERAALAARMGLCAIATLRCQFELRRGGDMVHAEGQLRARVQQLCVLTLDPFDADLAEDFSVRFVPPGSESEEVDLESEDEIPYQGNRLDLGEATAEQLALALDPFPRKPGAELPAHATGAPTGPFATLGKLRTPN